MTEPKWLRPDVVLAAHARQLARYGGLPGLRDPAVLESALARPINQFHYGERDMVALAAAYGFGLARNHPFADGNKRIALIAIALFLWSNDLRLVTDNEDAATTIVKLSAGEMTEGELRDWIRARSQTLPRSNPDTP